jgi:glycosyltransferase involved in cell wall biosynthesis
MKPLSRFRNVSIIDFYLSGTSSDSRKNHRQVIKIFEQLNLRIYDRDFRLHFVGMGDDEYSKETIRLAKDKLGDKFRFTKLLEYHQALKYINELHVCISVSEFETLPRVVTEALIAGQIILRNSSSGKEEQISNYMNGILIDEFNVQSSVDSIAELLDSVKFPEEKLISYGEFSLKMGASLLQKSMKDISYFE